MIDSKLNFHVQLNNVLSNMATAIRSIYHILYQLPLKARLMPFQSLVLSHLTFSEMVQGDIIQFADDTSFHFSRNNVTELEKCVSEIL